MSKLLMFDFECVNGHRFEELVRSEVHYKLCPQCGTPADRQISPVRIDYTGMATAGEGTETAIDRFDKAHRERRAIEERKYRDHGDYGKSPGSD